jgi:hypothetical protein
VPAGTTNLVAVTTTSAGASPRSGTTMPVPESYLAPFPGYYLSGVAATATQGYHIMGRVDDVISVAGRLSTGGLRCWPTGRGQCRAGPGRPAAAGASRAWWC